MWGSEKLDAAIQAFINEKQQVPIDAYFLLPVVLEETPAYTGKFPFADTETGLEVVKAIKAYTAFYRENDIPAVTEDRFIRNNKGPELFNKCYNAIVKHSERWSEEDMTPLWISSWVTVHFAMAIMGLLTSIHLEAYADDHVEDKKLKITLFSTAHGAANYSAEQFNNIADLLQEYIQAARSRTQAEIFSTVVHAFLGFIKEKTFQIVTDFASGKSPYQYLTALIERHQTIRICEDRSLYIANWIKTEHLDKV